MITIIHCHKCVSPTRSGKEPRHSKDTPYFTAGFSRRITSTHHRKILPGHHRHIRPVVPRRNTNLFRKLINPINRSAFVTSSNDKRFIPTPFKGADTTVIRYFSFLPSSNEASIFSPLPIPGYNGFSTYLP